MSGAAAKRAVSRPVPEPGRSGQDGELIEKNLRRERMTAEEIAAEARQQQIASLDAVEWAVVEGNGRVSFVTKR